jgi:energy-converting hydrogenase Eha subunit A
MVNPANSLPPLHVRRPHEFSQELSWVDTAILLAMGIAAVGVWPMAAYGLYRMIVG